MKNLKAMADVAFGKWQALKKLWKFQYSRRFNPLPELKLDFGSMEATDLVKKSICEADIYVEFGAGATTLYAAENSIDTISIESDRYFGDKLLCIAKNVKAKPNLELIVREFGLTTKWSKPIGPVTVGRQTKFRNYSEFPNIQNVSERKVFILIDGRFRIASALKSGLAVCDVKDHLIVVDDCEGRQYFEILKGLFKNSLRVGRLGVFSSPRVETEEYHQTLLRHESDPK